MKSQCTEQQYVYIVYTLQSTKYNKLYRLSYGNKFLCLNLLGKIWDKENSTL